MSTPTLRQETVDVAILVPVAPGFWNPAVATSAATLADELVVARSNCSLMPAGGVNVAVSLHAPPKTSSAFPVVVVIDGAVTEVVTLVFLRESDALIGAVALAPDTASMPPAMSCPEPPVSVNV